MEYTKKHKSLIAGLFRKAGMVEEAKRVLSCDDYKYEIANAMQAYLTIVRFSGSCIFEIWVIKIRW